MTENNFDHEARHQLKVMRALYGISVEISSRLEMQQVVSTIVKNAAELLGCTGSTLAVCEPETKLTHVVALHNIPYESEELILSPGASIASQVLVTGKPQIVNDIVNWDAAMLGKAGTGKSYHSILSVPLTWSGQINGALTVMDRQDRPPFDEKDLELLSLLANLASTAINNAALYSKVLQLNQQLENKVQERTSELNRAQDELKKLHAVTISLQEEERAHISRELHDGSNQLITGTLYEIQAAESSIKKGHPQAALERLETAKDVLRQIDAENRRIMSGLRPMALDAHGLFDAINKLVQNYNSLGKAQFEVNLSGKPLRLEPQIEIAVYRIIQESLNNAAEHSNAGCISVNIAVDATNLEIDVIDNGAGFLPEQGEAAARMGIIGMRERAKIIGGNLELTSKPGFGTKISLVLPLLDKTIPNGSQIKLLSASHSSPDISMPQQKKIIHSAFGNSKPSEIIFDIAAALEFLDEAEVIRLVQKAIADCISPLEILQAGIIGGLRAIGDKLESKIYSLGELLIATKLAEDCISIIKPHLPEASIHKRGVIVIGAVQGDIHSIGYGMVALMLELAGYEVHSLGVNVPSVTFVERAVELKADLIGLSAFLITTVSYCSEVMKHLADRGIREQFKVIIGGSETNQHLADTIGADGWSPDAFEAIRLCNRLMGYGSGSG